MTAATSNIRKAALLVRSPDGDPAALLLAQLSPQEARAVRQAVRELHEIDPDEQEQIAQELRRAEVRTPLSTDESGVELSFSDLLAEPSLPVPSPASSLPEPAELNSPFAWLEHGDLPTLASVLEREHLSTVAVVLSHLPPQRGADLLAALPPGRRTAALERLADLGESDRSSLEVIEKSLADWIARQKRERQLRADRLQGIRAMLEHTGSDTRDRLTADLARADHRLASELNLAPKPATSIPRSTSQVVPRLAGQVIHLRVTGGGAEPHASGKTSKPAATTTTSKVKSVPPPLPRFDFWQLQQLDQQCLGVLLGHCDVETVVLALAGGSDEIMHHVLRQLTPEAGRQLQRRVNHLNQIRLSDVAKAQQRVTLTAAELIACGKITLRRED